MTDYSIQHDFEISVPGYEEIIPVYEGGICKKHIKGAYRAIESFLPFGMGTVIVYSSKQYKSLYEVGFTQIVVLKDKVGQEFKYVVVGKEVVNLQIDRILVNSGKREIKIAMPFPLYGFPEFSDYHLVVSGVIL